MRYEIISCNQESVNVSALGGEEGYLENIVC